MGSIEQPTADSRSRFGMDSQHMGKQQIIELQTSRLS